MKTDNIARMRSDRMWLTADGCSIEEFAALVERTTSRTDYPFAAEIAADTSRARRGLGAGGLRCRSRCAGGEKARLNKGGTGRPAAALICIR